MSLYRYMVKSFNGIIGTYARDVPLHARESDFPLEDDSLPYLQVHLMDWLSRMDTDLVQNRSGGYCDCLDVRPNDDGRRPLPKAIIRCLKNAGQRWTGPQVTVTWIVAYLEGNFPDETMANWKKFQLSHRCLGANCRRICVTGHHLIWESASNNQSRGHSRCFCTKACTHCGQPLCSCQRLHDPPCI